MVEAAVGVARAVSGGRTEPGTATPSAMTRVSSTDLSYTATMSASRGQARVRRSATTSVAGALVLVAAAIHLALTPEHFAERAVYGAFFSFAGAFQTWLAWRLLLAPSPAVMRAGGAGSLALVVLWIVTRAVAPPLSPEGRPEDVTNLGVLATGAELAALVLLLGAAWDGSRCRRSRSGLWAPASGVLFGSLLLLATNAVSYISPGTPVQGLRVYSHGFSAASPLVYGRLLPGLWLVASWSTLLLVVLAAALLAVNVRMLLGGATLTPRATAVAALPSIFAVSACCGAPFALVLGTSAVVGLVRFTPLLLLGSCALLAANVVLAGRHRPRCSVAAADAARETGAEA
jgi:hypothetical protein